MMRDTVRSPTRVIHRAGRDGLAIRTDSTTRHRLTEENMAQRKTLSEAQVALLRWIGDGCPAGVVEGDSHRISAAALRNRGLVKITGPTASLLHG